MPNERERIHAQLLKTDRTRINPITPIPDEMEPIPLEALETLSALIQEKKRSKSSGTSSEETKPGTSHIVDITDQFVGKSLIITGVTPPKKPLTPAEREEALRKAKETATEKPQ